MITDPNRLKPEPLCRVHNSNFPEHMVELDGVYRCCDSRGIDCPYWYHNGTLDLCSYKINRRREDEREL